MTDKTEIPAAMFKEINLRNVKALETNVFHAETLHERGGITCLYDNLTVAAKAVLLARIDMHSCTPLESIGVLIEFLTDVAIPSFLNIPEVKKTMDGDPEILEFVGSLEEIIEQLQGLQDAEKETLQ